MTNSSESKFKSLVEAREFYSLPINKRTAPADIWSNVRDLPIENLSDEDSSWFINLGFRLVLTLSMHDPRVLISIGVDLDDVKEKTDFVQQQQQR